MEFEPVQTYIYGLYIGKICVYVGQSMNYENREREHRKKKKFERMRVLRSCSPENAGRIEQQIIAAFKRKGQCALNKSKAVKNYLYMSHTGIGVYVPSVKKMFPSKQQAAKGLGFTSVATTRLVGIGGVERTKGKHKTMK